MPTIRRLTDVRHVVRCAACGVTALKPAPTVAELERYYADYYLTRDKDEQRHRWLIDAHKPIVDYLLDHVGSLDRPCSFLDFGFGSGEFLIHVARRGHLAHGSDLSSRATSDLEALGRGTGLALRPVSLEHFSAPARLTDGAFDVITIFQVIEHLIDPLAMVRLLSQRQCPGGLLYVECPNDASGLAWIKSWFLFGDRRSRMWRSLKHPEHVHGFTRRSLRILLETAGYDVLDSEDYAYGDGLHQVESDYWWPAWQLNPARWTPYGASRSAIRTLDGILSSTVGMGNGLFALGRKRT